MKIFRKDELKKILNPDPRENTYRPEVLTEKDNAFSLGGMFGLLEPNSQVPYHYHKNRESVLIIISGEAVEVVDGKEYILREGDIVFLAAMEKHTIKNVSQNDVKYIEFYSSPPLNADFVMAEEK